MIARPHALRLLALAALALALGVGAQPTLAQDASAVDHLLTTVNAARAADGLPPYALNPLLSAAAQRHSEDMAGQATLMLEQGRNVSEAIVHTGSDGSRAADRVADTGYQAIQVGENVYATTAGPQAAFDWWMNSAEHRHNILHERYREIGIGVAQGPEGLVTYTLVFAHSEDSPVLPAPTQPPTSTPIPPSLTPTAAPTATATLSPTPTVTPTSIRINLPPAPTATPSPTATPQAIGGPFAPDRLPWIILLEVLAAGVVVYALVKLRR